MTFEFSPQKLVYGGHAFGHLQNRPVLVRQALPGERLEVELIRTAKGVMHARPLRILEAAPERVNPPCPFFGRCGGCQYQHFSSEHQTSWKEEILRETVRRIARITCDGKIPVYYANPWNYRNQARLKVAREADGTLSLGFYEAESHRLFRIDACLILSPRLNAILAKLRSQPANTSLLGCREVDIFADDRDEQAMLTLHAKLDQREAESVAKSLLDQVPGVETVAIGEGGRFRVFGKPALRYRVGEYQYQVSPGSFFQASRYLITDLVRAVVGNEAGEIALDLFAGVGLLTLPLAQRFKRVIGVEASFGSTRDLQANAEAHGLSNVRAIGETAYDFLRRFAQMGPDLVVLDPPREGVGSGTLKVLARCQPQRINYLSCCPPTFARDLADLIGRGYRLDSIELFDFFPQTYHIECLAKLTHRDRAKF